MQHPLYAKVGTTSPTSRGRSVGIVRSRTKVTAFSFRVLKTRKFIHEIDIFHNHNTFSYRQCTTMFLKILLIKFYLITVAIFENTIILCLGGTLLFELECSYSWDDDLLVDG
jgi:hypothetical protein